jgi:ankyrin repeat protein
MTTMRMPRPPRQRMFDAISTNNDNELQNALRAGANINDRSDAGFPTLNVATRCSTAVFKTVMAAGPDLNAIDQGGNTALHWAAGSRFGSYIENGQALIDAGADLSVRNVVGANALEHARAAGCEQLVRAIEARQAEDLRQQLERNTGPAPAFPDLNDPATLDQVAAQHAQPKRRGMRI